MNGSNAVHWWNPSQVLLWYSPIYCVETLFLSWQEQGNNHVMYLCKVNENSVRYKLIVIVINCYIIIALIKASLGMQNVYIYLYI